MAEEFDNYQQSMNFRHKDNLSPEFQVRILMYELNSLLKELHHTTIKMEIYYQIDNQLSVIALMLNEFDNYNAFDFKKFKKDPKVDEVTIFLLNLRFRKYAFEKYKNLIRSATDKGLWTIDYVNEKVE